MEGGGESRGGRQILCKAENSRMASIGVTFNST